MWGTFTRVKEEMLGHVRWKWEGCGLAHPLLLIPQWAKGVPLAMALGSWNWPKLTDNRTLVVRGGKLKKVKMQLWLIRNLNLISLSLQVFPLSLIPIFFVSDPVFFTPDATFCWTTENIYFKRQSCIDPKRLSDWLVSENDRRYLRKSCVIYYFWLHFNKF